MIRASTLALLFAAGAVAAACQADKATAPEATTRAGGPALAQKGSDLPFKETYAAEGTIEASARCPSGTLLVSLEGSGTATHVGRYTITNSHCLDLTTGAFTAGTFVKTAASGHQLVGTYSGSGTVLEAPGPSNPVGRFEVSGTLVFTGGTGRFATASGAVGMSGIQVTDFSAPAFPTRINLEMEGSFSW